MATPAFSDVGAEDLQALVERCKQLCQRAGGAVDGLPAERGSFLARNLDDALQQLELILRVLDDEAQEGGESRTQSLLRRLTRGLSRRKPEEQPESREGEEPAAELPSLDISRQSLQGNSWSIPLPDLIGFLAAGHKTGVLWVDSPEENFLIGLVDGKLMHATSDCAAEGTRMGEVLVGMGSLTQGQLDRFLEEREGDSLSGETLLEAGLISPGELQQALSHQAQQLFHRLIETKNAIFRFREGMEVMLTHEMSLNTTQLILESARQKDEADKQEPPAEESAQAPPEPAEEPAEEPGAEASADSGEATDSGEAEGAAERQEEPPAEAAKPSRKKKSA
jgi:hypothetical protein